jgi:DNA repair exonuclease SbcCD ATPase subunit
MLLNVNDPIQVHLLVETALGDSKEFEILSPEEVDELKKQCRSLSQRIDQTRQNLAIQSKYRDAAISMAKLYSGSDRKGIENTETRPKQRRSLLGSRGSNSDQVKEADLERIASERRCEELAQELWNLEKRLMEPQKRLLQHTAGILQMTHKGPATVQKTNGTAQQGIPGSPESLYTYTNARSSMDPPGEEDLFDERSLYRAFDRMGGPGVGGQRDTWDLQSRGLSITNGQSREQVSEQMRTIATTEQKLETLNTRLRQVIVKANPQQQSYSMPPRAVVNEMSATPGKMLLNHLDYLEQSINIIDSELNRSKAMKQDSDIEIEEAVEEINGELRALLLPCDPNRPLPPRLSGRSLKEQLSYLQNSIGAIEGELQRAASVHSHSKGLEAQQENIDQMQSVINGLWDTIQSGEEENRRRKLQNRQMRAQNGIADDGSDMSGDEMLNLPKEAFSLQAFSSKVQRIFSQLMSLKDQKKVLQRQIKQQRELNNKEESEKDAQLSKLEEDLARTQQTQEAAEREAQNLQSQLRTVIEQLDKARRENAQQGLEKQRRDDSESAAVQALEVKLSQRNDEIIRLEEELQDLKDDRGIRDAEIQSRLAEAGAKVEALSSQLSKAEEEAATWTKRIEDKEAELEHSNMEIARLQTEVTIARAELDGAYGTRAQRAAEVAANPAIQKEIDDLTTRNKKLQAELEVLRAHNVSGEAMAELKRELSETIEDYEHMTKASIEWEKEREMLEREVDKLRDEREALETRLADEQVRWLGMKNQGADNDRGVGAGATSTAVLKSEFKKIMRDARTESAKALRVCPHHLIIPGILTDIFL